MKVLLTLLVVAAALVAGVLFVAYSGVPDVSALGSQPRLVEWFLVTAREHAIEARAEKIAVPDLAEPRRVEAGLVHYHTMCVSCHGAPGLAPSEVGKGLNPTPPDLSRHGFDDDEAAEAFWILQNGIRMTGMPAFGATHTDEQLWDVVAFLRRLPELSPEAYAEMVERAGLASEPDGHSHGHDAPGEPHPQETDGTGHPHQRDHAH